MITHGTAKSPVIDLAIDFLHLLFSIWSLVIVPELI